MGHDPGYTNSGGIALTQAHSGGVCISKNWFCPVEVYRLDLGVMVLQFT